jgi:hypothetical protein
MTEDERFEREYRHGVEYSIYIERKLACLQAGYIWVTTFQERHGKPSIIEMRTARCVLRVY